MTATACSGLIGEGSSADDEPEPPGIVPGVDLPGLPAALAPAHIRRLTTTEVLNSVRDVFLAGDATVLAPVPLPATVATGRFDNLADTLTVDLGFMDFLKDLGAVLHTAVARIAPCPAGTAEATCVSRFIQTTGGRAYRRPLTSGEVTRLGGVFSAARQGGASYELALGTVAEAMVHSSSFLYRTELGAPGQAGRARMSLTPYEVASELSYFLWQSAPDEALLQAAAAGQLDAPRGIEQQAERMVADPRTKGSLRSMFQQWLNIDRPDQILKTTSGFSAAVAQAMVKENAMFIDDLLWGQTSSLSALFTSTTGFSNRYLRPIYGTGSTTDTFNRVNLDPGSRSGILTQAGFVAAHTPAGQFNPIFMGLAVRSKFLCQPLPDPPPQVPELPKDPELSTRDRLAVHSRNPGCAVCHTRLDPVGFGFEKYGVTGLLREFEVVGRAARQVPLTGQGELTNTDVDGPFAGPVALGRKLAASAVVRECFAAQMMEYAFGRPVADPGERVEADARTLGALAAGVFRDGDIKRLLAGVVGTDVFRLRDAHAVPGGMP